MYIWWNGRTSFNSLSLSLLFSCSLVALRIVLCAIGCWILDTHHEQTVHSSNMYSIKLSMRFRSYWRTIFSSVTFIPHTVYPLGRMYSRQMHISSTCECWSRIRILVTHTDIPECRMLGESATSLRYVERSLRERSDRNWTKTIFNSYNYSHNTNNSNSNNNGNRKSELSNENTLYSTCTTYYVYSTLKEYTKWERWWKSRNGRWGGWRLKGPGVRCAEKKHI